MKSNPYKKNKIKKHTDRTTSRSRFKWNFHLLKKLKEEKITELSEKIHKEKPIYLDSYQSKQRPAWLVPVLVAVAVLLLVFWTGPSLLDLLSTKITKSPTQDISTNLRYHSSIYAVVSVQSADLLLEPDLRALRSSQVFYNDLVKILDQEVYGFLHVEMQDGATGYLMSSVVTSNTSSVEPNLYKHKLTVISKSKRIMSHASNGSLLMEVFMGSVLYSDYQGEGIFRVALPDKTFGWVSSEGIVRSNVNERPALSSAKKFCETVLSFVNTTYIENGLTPYGASSTGVVYICAKINGIDIPRDINAQSKFGTEVIMEKDENNLPLYDELMEGDLVFFRDEMSEKDTVNNMGIVVGKGQLLMSIRSKNSIKLVSLSGNTDLVKSIISVRRIFDKP